MYIDEQLSSSVQKVIIYNASTLQLSESVCASVELHSVQDVVVVEGQSDPCPSGQELTARNSTLNRLPRQVSHVHLEDSSITSLVTAANITQLTVVNSRVEVLNISRPLLEGSSATFQTSSIDTLRKLHGARKSNMIFYKTNISVIVPGGLVVDGHAVMRETSTISVSEGSVIMGPGAKLSLEQHSGNLKIEASTVCKSIVSLPELYLPIETVALSCPSKSSSNCSKGLIACLILMIISVMLVLAGLYIRNICRKNKTEEEDSFISHKTKNTDV